MPNFDALMAACNASRNYLNDIAAARQQLSAIAVQNIYDAHFGGNAFQTGRSKQRPQYDVNTYPSLFSELRILTNGEGLSTNDLPFEWTTEAISESVANNPLAKLLLAFIWKQGDLKTVAHVLSGLCAANQDQQIPENGIVMYQFGRHLAHPLDQPIFDQHTYRAFQLITNITKWETREGLNQLLTGNRPANRLIDYLTWWNQSILNRLPNDISQRQLAILWVDRLLFSLGKAAKLQVRQ